MELSKAKIYTDGASRGNPGHAGIGVLICDENDFALQEFSKYIGHATNNQAEYSALIEALTQCKKLGIKNIDVFMDSELVVRQLTGVYRVKNENIKPLYAKVLKLKPCFDEISFKHIRREQNKEADKLANQALDDRKTSH